MSDYISTSQFFQKNEIFISERGGVIRASLPGYTARLEKVNFEICLLPQVQKRIKEFQRILAKGENPENQKKNYEKLMLLKMERDAIKFYNIPKLMEILKNCIVKRYIKKSIYMSQIQKFGYSSSDAIFFCPESMLYDQGDPKKEEEEWEAFQEKCVYKGYK